MKTASTTPQTIDAYIASRPPEHHKSLQQLRALAHECIPGAEECINYSMPALRSHGRVIVWFASFQHHVGLFPRAKAIEVYADELSAYSTSKGTIRFDHTARLPVALIRKVIRFCLKEQQSIAESKKSRVNKVTKRSAGA